MPRKFYPGSFNLIGLLLLCAGVFALGVLAVMFGDNIGQQVFGGLLILIGLVGLAAALSHCMPLGYLVRVDSHGIFDRRSMTVPVPWSDVTDVSATLWRFRQNVRGVEAVSKFQKVAIKVDNSDPYTKELRGVRAWQRRQMHKVSKGNVFEFHPGFLIGGADALIATMAEFGPLSASRARVEYLRAVRRPEKTAAGIARELSRERWLKADAEDVLAVIAAALDGPRFPEVETAVTRLADNFVVRYPGLAVRTVRACIKSGDQEMLLVAGCINHALDKAGHRAPMTEEHYATSEEFTSQRDAGPSGGRRTWSGLKAVFFGVCAIFFVGIAVTSFDTVRFDCAHEDCWYNTIAWGFFLVGGWFFGFLSLRNWRIANGRPVKYVD